MQISTKGRYALRFLIDLSQRRNEGSVSLKSIAERQGISKKYLENIIAMLTPSDMFNITRGYQGGYQLAKDPADITVADVLNITEGGLSPVSDPDSNDPMSAEVWKGLEKVITDYLEGVTLRDLADKYSSPIEYYI